MLGLADRGRIFDLLERLLAGAAGEALEQFAQLHRDGAEPQQVLADLAQAVHVTTRAKSFGAEAAGEGLSGEEKRRAAALGGRVSIAILSRAWQMLLKGLEEAADAPNPAAAAEMVLIRLAYTADLPPPDEIIKALGGDAPAARPGGTPPAAPEKRAPAGAPADAAEPDENGWDSEAADEDALPDLAAAALPVVRSFAEVVALAGARREAKLKVHLEEHVSLVKFEAEGRIELHLLAGAPKEVGNELREKLNAWTGKRWIVALSSAPGERTIGAIERERAAAEIRDIQKHPAVAAVLQQFPDAQITSVRPLPDAKTDDTGTG
jgi:DNA polymerase-3 subunit gamma/tau